MATLHYKNSKSWKHLDGVDRQKVSGHRSYKHVIIILTSFYLLIYKRQSAN